MQYQVWAVISQERPNVDQNADTVGDGVCQGLRKTNEDHYSRCGDQHLDGTHDVDHYRNSTATDQHHRNDKHRYLLPRTPSLLGHFTDHVKETTTSTEIFSTTVVQTLTTTITVVSSEIITIPTPTGFTPVASDVTYVPKRRGIRAALSLLQRAKTPEVETIKIDRGGKTHAFSPPVYPQAVKCVKRDRSTTAKTITMPFCTKTKSTTLPPSTATAYDTLTNLVTQTVDQNAATLISTEFTTVTEVTSFTSTQVNITTITGNLCPCYLANTAC